MRSRKFPRCVTNILVICVRKYCFAFYNGHLGEIFKTVFKFLEDENTFINLKNNNVQISVVPMRFRVTRVLCVSFCLWGVCLPACITDHMPGVCIQEGLLRGWGRVGIRASLHPGGGQTSPIGRPGILQDMVNKRAVRILLECFLVLMDFITPSHVLLVRMFWLCAKPIFITDIPKPFKKSKRSSGGSRISPRRGRQLPRGERQHTILPYFPKNCMKLKEFGPGGDARPSRPPLDPPLRRLDLSNSLIAKTSLPIVSSGFFSWPI